MKSWFASSAGPNILMKILFGLLLLLLSCASPPQSKEIQIAAAANLQNVLREVVRLFEAKTGTHTVLNFGSTAQLAQQIESGAPYDVFLSADVEHIDALIAKRVLDGESRTIYTIGKLALWFPDPGKGSSLADLAETRVRSIGVADPALAPYGKAAVELLKNSGNWVRVEAKLVFAANIGMAKQYGSTGNVDAVLTAASLLIGEKGNVVALDPTKYSPLQQGAAVRKASPAGSPARAFLDFLKTEGARSVFDRFGYGRP